MYLLASIGDPATRFAAIIIWGYCGLLLWAAIWCACGSDESTGLAKRKGRR